MPDSANEAPSVAPVSRPALYAGLLALLGLAALFIVLVNLPAPRAAAPQLAGALAPVSLASPIPTPRTALSALPTFTPVPASAIAAAVNQANPQSGQPPAGSLPLTVARLLGSEGNGPGQFLEPRAIAVGKDGRVYVTDTGNRRVQAFDSEGRYLFAFDSSDGENKFGEPFGMVMTTKGELIVMDAEDGRMYRFDANGRPLGALEANTRFYKPRGFSIDKSDNLYIADTGGSRIVKLDPDGNVVLSLAERGKGPGQFDQPCDAIGDPSGEIWVSDCVTGRIQLFSPDGAFKLQFPIAISDPLNGSRLALGPDQTLYVAAAPAHKVLKYSRTGQLLGDFGSEGRDAGQFRIPTGIMFAGTAIWVADTLNGRVQKLQIK